jgi:hypothetical protein
MYGFGSEIVLVWNYDLPVAQQLSVPLSQLDNEFVLGLGGEGYLDRLGIDLVDRKKTLPQPVDLALGGVALKGVAYGVKYEIPIRLQKLTKAKFDRIQQFVAAQRNTGKLIRLDNKRIPLTEYGARTRPIASGTATTADGFVTYYPSFLVWISGFDRRIYEGDGRGQLEFTAIEYGAPLTP